MARLEAAILVWYCHLLMSDRGVARNKERGFLNVCARENNVNIHDLSAKLHVVSGLIQCKS